MKNLIVRRQDNGPSICQLEDLDKKPLATGQVRIRSHYSGLNYKDALGVTGLTSIYKKFPIIPGIDVSGEVIESNSKTIKTGQQILINGGGLGESHDGGYTEEAIEHESNIVPLPKGLSTMEAMIYGTAGFTAALALKRMLINGQSPTMGPILVTGASGGVGQFAIEFFAKSGFEVWALTGKKSKLSELLKTRGATKVLSDEDLPLSSRPLDKAILGGIVDNIGGKYLSGLIPQVNLWGNISCVGLAAGAELNTTVMPLILRGVSLLGASSNNTPHKLRQEIWQDLATNLKPKDLKSYVTKTIGMEDVVTTAQEMLARKTSGRVLINLQ